MNTVSKPYPYSVPTHHLGFEEPTFQEILAAQLRHAPWLGVSLTVHGAVFGLLLLLPPPRPTERASALEMAQNVPETPPDIEKPEPPQPPEPAEAEPRLVDQTDQPVAEVESTGESTVENPDAPPSEKAGLSAFDGFGDNTAVGLRGGAAPRWAGTRGSGRPRPPSGAAQEVAIGKGLIWLKNHQDEDGKWDADEFMKHDLEGPRCGGPGNPVHDVGLTGLALLAFLGDGSTMRSGPYRAQIKKGIAWLVEQQQETGLIGQAASHDFVYDHAIATYALCEAYGLSEYRLLRSYAQKAINYLEAHRNPYLVWRYQPRDGDNDTSVTGWCVMALKSASDFKLLVDKKTLELAKTWFDQVIDPATGRAGYAQRGQPSSRHAGAHATRFPPERGEAMTGVALMCRYFLGQDPKSSPTMATSAALIASKPPRWNEKDGSIDVYAWYYGSYALYQHGGPLWAAWSKTLDAALIRPQRQDGNFAGSWDPEPDVWGEDGGRVYMTAMGVLTLEAYYRYTRLIR
jgi:hypothetical protein